MKTGRWLGVDVFRGATMIAMVTEGFGLKQFGPVPLVSFLATQFSHADWHGMHAWDLIQPFFMFIVGLVMPVSFARRWAAGESWPHTLRHVLRRAALLLLCGLLARSIQAGRPVIDVINVLGQLAFTYPVAFLVLRQPLRMQALVALGILAVHTALYLFVELPGVTGPWDKNANFGWALDGLLLGKHWGGGYVTVNCLSSATATIAGVMTGTFLSRQPGFSLQARTLLRYGLILIAAGLALNQFIPINKKVWTASFALVSIGLTLPTLLFFQWLCEERPRPRWTNACLWVGANSIFIYMFHEILHRWLAQTGLVFTGWAVDLWGPGGKLLNGLLVVAFEIYVCYWLYQRKIFFKL